MAEIMDETTADARPARDIRAERPSQRPETDSPDGKAEHGEPPPGQEAPPSLLKRHPVAAAVTAGLVLIAAIAGGVGWWLTARARETTDDAFIDARVVPIAPAVAGLIMDVPVTDNQPVEAGTLLARIDDRDYRSAVDQAVAQVDQARANAANLDAQLEAQAARIDQAQKQVAQADAAVNFARAESARAQSLAKNGTNTVEQVQQAESTLRQDQATYDAAKANASVAEKQTAVLKTQRDVAAAALEQAQAALTAAKNNLSRTAILAPVAGRVTKLSAAKGAYAQVGQALLMFVPRDIWITANFKETQLYDLRAGQPVEIRVDAYPGRSFAGHIDSIQAGAGPAFALLPPENATGNYVKVVQRVPVKIVFDRPPDVYLGPGMSVVPDVKVR